MSSITRFENDGIELIIDTQSGAVFGTQGMIAKMCKVESTQIRRMWGNDKSPELLPVMDSRGVEQLSKVYDENFIFDCLAKYNPQVLAQCAKAGLRIYLHGIAGFKYQVVKPKTALELAREQVKLLEEVERIKSEKKLLEQENHQLSEAVDELFDYSSIIRVAKFNNCSEKAFSWRKLKAASLAMKLEIKRVPCPRFEYKCLYSHDVWRYVYPKYRLPETTTLTINR